MKNLYKIFALILVFTMVFGLFTMATDVNTTESTDSADETAVSANPFVAGPILVDGENDASFTDADEIAAEFKDAVNVLTVIKVLGGFPDGSFKPAANITRAQFAKMAYVLTYGSDDQGKLFAGNKSSFVDVEGVSSVAWAKGYINYCAANGVVSGVGGNRFNPNGKITVVEAAKMLLVVLGCDAKKEGFTGTNWAANVVAKAMELAVFDGWVGDAMDLASRQLTAQLMKNTLFAPTYIYSPITGTGSRFNAVTNEENITLAQKAMKLKVLKGTFVGNEYAYLPILNPYYEEQNKRDFPKIDEKGDPKGGVDGQGGLRRIQPRSVPAGQSVIFYEFTDDTYANYASAELNRVDYNGPRYEFATIDAAISEEYLGRNFVVLCTAEGEQKYGNLSNVKVVGTPIVDAESVAVTAKTFDTRFYPNYDQTASRSYVPYVSFKDYQGKEYKMAAFKGQDRVKGNVTEEKVSPIFEPLFYYTTNTVRSIGQSQPYDSFYDSILATRPYDLDNLINNPTVYAFRFISNDGGDTFSYGILTHTFNYNEVSNISDNSITIVDLGTKSGDDYRIIGEKPARGDYVYYYPMNGRIYVQKVKATVGKIDDISGDKIISINGEEFNWDPNYFEQKTISAYYLERKIDNLDGNIYYSVNGTIFKLEKATLKSDILSGYAVVLGTSLTSVGTASQIAQEIVLGMATARIRLGFTDGTSGVYTVSKPFTSSTKTLVDAYTTFTEDYARGVVLRYKILENGKVDLSFDDPALIKPVAATTNGIYYGNFRVNNKDYQPNKDSIVFIIYKDGERNEFKVYNLPDLEEFRYNPAQGEDQEVPYAYAKATSETGLQTLLVGSLYIGEKDELKRLSSSTTGESAYLLEDMSYQMNLETNKWYVTARVATADGEKEFVSVDEVMGVPELSGRYIGSVVPGFKKGTIFNYKLNDAGKIQSFGTGNKDIFVQPGVNATQEMFATGNDADGWYLTTVGTVQETRMFCYPFFNGDVVPNEGNALINLRFADEYDVATIQGESQIGTNIEVAYENDTVVPVYYNAIVYVEHGKVTKVFSLVDGNQSIDYEDR